MSQENVKIVKATFEAWNAGDMEAVRELYDSDVYMRPPQGWPEPGPFVGREAAIRQFEQNREAFNADTLEPLGDFIDATDHVFVRFIWHGVGSGPESHIELTGVFTVRRGRIVFVEFFWDHAEALETLGLSEQDAGLLSLRGTARARSQENVEIVRAGIEAWNAGDMDALREGYDPDVIVRAPAGWPEPGPFVGREALVRQWAQQRDTFEADSVELITDFIHVADRVVVRFVWHGTGHGPETGLEMTQVSTVRKGRTIYQEFFWDHAEALEAVGLSEQDARADSS